jgi:hypothetical protein
LLKAGLGSALLFGRGPALVWAQGAGGPQLVKLPKIALVIGNAAYAQSPLKNPVNDAKGMGEALNSLGFEVTLRVDANRAAMRAVVEAYLEQLARRKCVGLFYFAGHGVQIDWKNYLLPADAKVASNDDVQAQALDVTSMASGLARAGNALNLIILDACRDAPFGEGGKPAQRGLSQMDAPRSTLLAYATAPGNVASDGEGANGLYTENLLREIRVPDAKVEDVFKRVRLAVRRSSGGAQIPWESTSLEDDYYFRPPPSLAPPTDEERTRRFAEELRLWEAVEKQAGAAPFEDYLRRYPSGNFCELAQFRLDRILAAEGEKRVEVVVQKENPYAVPVARTDTRFRVGDTYISRASDLFTGAPQPSRKATVISISDTEVHFDNGRINDLLGNTRRAPDGRLLYGAQLLPLEYALGKNWVTRYNGKSRLGQDMYTELNVRITAAEKVVVPAGTFDCFRLEYTGVTRPFLPPSWNAQHKNIFWMAPAQCRVAIKAELHTVLYGGPRGSEVLEQVRLELESFRQG